MPYQEKVTCIKCNHSYVREAEILKNRFSNLEIPLQIALIKKSECTKCKSDECKIQFIKEKENIVEKVV